MHRAGRVQGDEVVPFYGDQGRRVPLHATSVGLVLLAHAGELLQSEVCAAPLHAYTRHTMVDGTAPRRYLSKVRCDG
ncbi:IclR family transcriptional regulator domain-containing protein [Streptomyces cyaneus]|uniref:IclR family transcriptional regulator domain-containing protein n=1 Tax=Streptomyces cyaneus TaxID=1904 RepID=UPI000FF8AA9D|nr:IclR family transcriptional regulator C-terminal domain-containing protein [Streptomyces cyaneus]